MSRKFALLLLAPALVSTPVQAQEAPSGEQSASTAQPAQCGTRRPTIFGGRASTQPCVVSATTSQMRCKATRPTIFGGGSSSGACVPEYAGAQTASYRPTIFGGRRSPQSASAGYQATQPAYAGTYSQPGAPQAAYGQDQSGQTATGAAPAQAEQPKGKRRRPTIFGGGRRAKNPE